MADIYQKCLRKLTSENQLQYLDYPRPDPSREPGRARLYGDHYGFTPGGVQHPHACCGGTSGSKGCINAPVVSSILMLVAVAHPDPKDASMPRLYNLDYGVYAMDTESIHTKKGIEICKVTVVDSKCNVVYDEYCLPTTDIIDYSTIWSGIKEEHLKNVTKTTEEMRNDLLALFNKDTILVGHGLGSDLMLLKIFHSKVIDTLILYPHNRGLPLRRSLKDIAKTELRRDIQNGDGHDSKEDAEVTMRLLLRKL